MPFPSSVKCYPAIDCPNLFGALKLGILKICGFQLPKFPIQHVDLAPVATWAQLWDKKLKFFWWAEWYKDFTPFPFSFSPLTKISFYEVFWDTGLQLPAYRLWPLSIHTQKNLRTSLAHIFPGPQDCVQIWVGSFCLQFWKYVFMEKEQSATAAMSLSFILFLKNS